MHVSCIDMMAPLGTRGVDNDSRAFRALGLRAVCVKARVDDLIRAGLRAKTIAAGLACATLILSTHGALSARCKPNHFRPPFFIKTMGPCTFDPQTLSFSGTPVEQAKCLMRGMDHSRNLAPQMETLPPALATRVGSEAGLPSRETLSGFLSKQDLEWDFAAYLWQPASRADDNDPNAPMARYFVIHDTSGPNFGHRSFPADVDATAKFNNLYNFACADGWGKAHVVVNRAGDMLVDHELAIPWRETKFEQAANFAGALKGLFLHVELIQPRRSASGRGRRNDAESPDPAFTAAQYDRLALLYVIASVRAEHWLIPAFHAAIDANIRNGHDDPLNFDVEKFADSLERVVEKLQTPEQAQVANSAPAGEPDAASGPNSSATASSAAADTAPWAPAAMVKSDAPAQRSAENPPHRETERQSDADRAIRIESKSERREAGRESVSAEHCQTRVARGHRGRVCRTVAAETRRRGKPAHVVRSVDRGVSQQGFGAWHHGGDVHARHARGASRHGRA